MTEQPQAPQIAAAPSEPQEGAGDESQGFSREYVEKLRRDAAKYRTEAKSNATAAAELAKIRDARKSDEERRAEAAVAIEKRATESDLRAARAEIALEKGLTLAQAKRLVGATREELEADADEVLRDFPTSRTTSPSYNGGPRTTAPSTREPRDEFARLMQGFTSKG